MVGIYLHLGILVLLNRITIVYTNIIRDAHKLEKRRNFICGMIIIITEYSFLLHWYRKIITIFYRDALGVNGLADVH